MSLHDTIKRKEKIVFRNDGSDQCKALCPICKPPKDEKTEKGAKPRRPTNRCVMVANHPGKHQCLNSHIFEQEICSNCGAGLHKEGKRYRCKKCGFIKNDKGKTIRQPAQNKPWRDTSSSLVGPHNQKS